MSPFIDLPLERGNEIVALNLTGTMLCCQAAARLIHQPGRRPRHPRHLIDPSAAGVAGTPRILRHQGGGQPDDPRRCDRTRTAGHPRERTIPGNHRNTIDRATRSLRRGRRERAPPGAGAPRDMASAAVFLCSPASRFTTGPTSSSTAAKSWRDVDHRERASLFSEGASDALPQRPQGRNPPRILAAAGRRMKLDGIDGSGVATLMADAGLTNGAFYAHFRLQGRSRRGRGRR